MPSKPASSFLQTWLCGLAIVLVTAAALWPVCRAKFLTNWDDQVTLTGNTALNPPTVDGVANFWKKPTLTLYVPVTYSTWAMLAHMSQGNSPGPHALDPALFHAANLVGHVLSALVVFAILRLLIGSDLPATLGAMVFALHPMQVEPVAWASGLKDVLCGLLSLYALWQYLIFARETDRGAGRWLRYGLATAAFALALLAKPSAVTVPLLAAILDFFVLRRRPGQIAKSILPWLLLTIPIILIARLAQPGAQIFSPLWSRPLVAGDALAWYVMKLLAPINLTVDYGRTPDFILRRPITYAIWIIPAALIAAALLVRRATPLVAAAIFIFIAALLPYLGLATFDFQGYSTVADHYLYVAMLGPAIFSAWLVMRFRGSWPWMLAALVLLAMGTCSFAQTKYWHDSDALFAHEIEVNPTSLAAERNAAYAATQEGYANLAITLYEKALQDHPGDGISLFNLGNIWYRSAAQNIEYQISQRSITAPGYRAAVFMKAADYYQQASQHLSGSLRILALYRLGITYEVMGRNDSAILAYQQALSLDPDDPSAPQIRAGLARLGAPVH
jgi:protein O-mannosyl-transferase